MQNLFNIRNTKYYYFNYFKKNNAKFKYLVSFLIIFKILFQFIYK
jgi:hypothetical protein